MLRRLTWIPVATAILVIATACTGSGGTIRIPEQPANSAGTGELQGTTGANTGSTPDASTNTIGTAEPAGQIDPADDPFVSAIDRAITALDPAQDQTFGTEEFGMSMAELTSVIDQVEHRIGKCMANAGFEYIPVDFSTVRQAMSSDKTAAGFSAGQYLAEFGHGITTQPDKPIVRIGIGEQNRRIFDNQAPADQVAYERTLLGEDRNATFAFSLEVENFSRTGGCTRSAIEQVFTPDELAVTYFNPADAYIMSDPRAQEALAAYASCMTDAGFIYQHPDDIDFDLQIRYNSITQGRDPEELGESQQAALAALQQEELAIAAANFGCETSVLEPVLDRIETEVFGR